LKKGLLKAMLGIVLFIRVLVRSIIFYPDKVWK